MTTAPETERRRRAKHLPRKLKKAIKRWLNEAEYDFSGRNRTRFLRWIERQRHANGMPPLKRMADGRINMLDLI